MKPVRLKKCFLTLGPVPLFGTLAAVGLLSFTYFNTLASAYRFLYRLVRPKRNYVTALQFSRDLSSAQVQNLCCSWNHLVPWIHHRSKGREVYLSLASLTLLAVKIRKFGPWSGSVTRAALLSQLALAHPNAVYFKQGVVGICQHCGTHQFGRFRWCYCVCALRMISNL